MVATPDPTIDLRYEVTATVVARGSEGSGAVAEERFTWDGDVYLSDITSDDATTTARWFSSTSRR
ncbi:hypothetical protein [Janibacter sp. UYMM211]|uniref:hypothetical protein n=1 Tax=Janibacter sp. UYMM211 TaxID=3156342 RepID=UPI003392D522